MGTYKDARILNTDVELGDYPSVFIGEVFGLAGGSWIKIRAYAVAGVAITLLVTPFFVQTHYHLTPSIQQFNCSYSYCNLAQPVIDWLFRFELGVVKLISYVT